MKTTARLAALLLAVALGSWLALRKAPAQWQGVDATVVERFARQAGRGARRPYIDTDRGDMLLFVFLLAGISGGFLGGYCFRELFGPGREQPHV